MGDHDNPATCLSSKKHDDHIRDAFLHYSGCLRETGRPGREETNRATYFSTLKEHEKRRITMEQTRIENLRALFNHEEEETHGLAKQFQRSLHRWRGENSPQNPLGERRVSTPAGDADTEPRFVKPDKANVFDFQANMIFYENSQPASKKGSLDQFPDQKIPLKTLLYDKDPASNPLVRKCEEGEIRYFHIPGNNMEWVEEAIALHYN